MGASTALMYAGQQQNKNNNNSTTTSTTRTTTFAATKNYINNNNNIRTKEEDTDDSDATATVTQGKGSSNNVYNGKESVITNTNNDNNSNTIHEENTNLNQNASIIKGMICDSPFASLTILCEELVERARDNGVMVPGVIVSVAIAMIARSVRLLANFNIRDITPIEDVANIQHIPALFVVGADDDFIPPHHSERLVEAYTKGVTTNLFMIPGGHNDARPKVVYHGIEEFCQQRLSIPLPDQTTTIPAGMLDSIHQNPPWAYRRTIHFQEHQSTGTSSFTTSSSHSKNKRPTLFSKQIPPPPPLPRHQKKEEATTIESTSVSVSAADTAAAELGMTKDRQDDIQDKIGMLMLGKK